MKMLTRSFILSAALVMTATAGCTLEAPDVPPLTGPSTFALDLTVTATPDILPEDGMATSVIRIVARDHNNQPVANLPLRIDTVIGSTVVDIGELSARNVTTNSNGEATVVFRAPRARFAGVDTQTVVNIRVLQVGSGFGGTLARSVGIRLVPESVVFVPGSPVPSFTFTPTNPSAGDLVQFDASASTDEGGTIVKYRWDYGDGDVEERTFPRESHDFVAPGTYFVTLTVTDNQGNTSSLTKAITVSGS